MRPCPTGILKSAYYKIESGNNFNQKFNILAILTLKSVVCNSCDKTSEAENSK